MGKTKINFGENNIFVDDQSVLRFSKERKRAFSYLLSSDGLERDIFFYNEAKETRIEFDDFIDDYENRKCFFVGFRGTGKSAFLFNYFKMDANKSFWVSDDTLYWRYISMGNTIVEFTDEMLMLAEIENLCKFLQNSYSLPGENEKVLDLYEFIVDTKESVLRNSQLKREKDSVESFQEELKLLKNNRTITYRLMILKFYLLNYITNIKKVILIFDFVTDEVIFENLLKKINECMLNFNRDKFKSGYCVKGIYTIRPTVYRSLALEQKGFEIIEKKIKMNMPKLFQERFDHAFHQEDIWWEQKGFDKSDLSFAWERIKELNSIFSGKYQKMIQGLSFFDIHEVLKCYRNIIFNTTWVQKKEYFYTNEVSQANKGFLFNNITCIRALACQNQHLYMGSSINTIIPNILYNTEDEEYGIYILLLMKYFVRRKKKDMNDCFGEQSGEEYLETLFNIEKIWGKGKDYENFREAIKYMLDQEILRKSIYSKKSSMKIRNEIIINDIVDYGCIYISTRGAELWDMLQNDSVLMEICREDYYREEKKGVNFESSYQLISAGKQWEIFWDLLLMIEDLKKEEDKLYKRMKKEFSDEFERMFGRKRMTYFLLEGVNKSIAYSSSCSNMFLKNKSREIEKLVNETR